MVALTAVSGAFFTLLFSFHVQVRETRRLYDRTVALEWARSQIEAVRGLSREGVLALHGKAEVMPLESVRNLPSSRGVVTAQARADATDALDVRVTLEWSEAGGGVRSITLSAVWTPEEEER